MTLYHAAAGVSVCMPGPITAVFRITDTNDDFEDLFRKANTAARDEAGTLTHRMFRQDDGTVRLYDDYASSEALLAHMQNATESGLMEQLMSAGKFEEVVILGEPSPQLREALEPLGAVVAGHVTGFSKLGLADA